MWRDFIFWSQAASRDILHRSLLTCHPYSMTLVLCTIEISWKDVTRHVMSHIRCWWERLDYTCTTMTLTQHDQMCNTEFTIAVSIYHVLTFTEDTNWTNCSVFSFRKASMSLSNSAFEGWLKRWHKSSHSLPRRVERCLNSEKSSISSLACMAWSKPSHTVRALGSGHIVQRAVAALMRTCRQGQKWRGGAAAQDTISAVNVSNTFQCSQLQHILHILPNTTDPTQYKTTYSIKYTNWNCPKWTAFLVAEYNGLPVKLL